MPLNILSKKNSYFDDNFFFAKQEVYQAMQAAKTFFIAYVRFTKTLKDVNTYTA